MMDSVADLPNFLAQELYHQLLSLDGLPTGVSTPTTPTLTPTTLRTIAADIMNLEAGGLGLSFGLGLEQAHTQAYHNEAGFVPPVVHPTPVSAPAPAPAPVPTAMPQSQTYINMVDSKAWQGGSVTTQQFPAVTSSHQTPVTLLGMATSAASAASVTSASLSPSPGPSLTPSPTPITQPNTPARRNVGGRRPTKAKGISPEEEERRQVRRERNKAAAARCRKRRVDHTNALLIETDGLEDKKQSLQNEIKELKSQVEELEYLLDTHKAAGTCRHLRALRCASPSSASDPPDVKPLILPFPVIKQEPLSTPVPQPQPPQPQHPPPAKRPMLTMPAPAPAPAPAPTQTQGPKPSRPTSLPVPSHMIGLLKTQTTTASEVAGIPISTPSTGIPFNFDSLMDGGTGLTPVSLSGPLVPSCSSQQRNMNLNQLNQHQLSVDMHLASPDGSVGNKLVSL